MKRLLAALILLICLTAEACNSVTPTPLALSPATITPLVPTEYVPTPFPVTPTYAGCAYVSGSQDIPELSRQLNASLQEISTDVTGLAYAYGENCVYGDGHSTFSAMETDFRIGVKVKTLRDEGNLGNWISKVMTIVLALPADQLQGPRSGRVDFDFRVPDPANLFVTVPIDKYRSQADNLHGADLLHLFLNNP